MKPTKYINIFNFGGPCGQSDVTESRAEAVKEAEDWAYRYMYTLTDAGQIDLTPEFSETFQARATAYHETNRLVSAMREK